MPLPSGRKGRMGGALRCLTLFHSLVSPATSLALWEPDKPVATSRSGGRRRGRKAKAGCQTDECRSISAQSWLAAFALQPSPALSTASMWRPRHCSKVLDATQRRVPGHWHARRRLLCRHPTVSLHLGILAARGKGPVTGIAWAKHHVMPKIDHVAFRHRLHPPSLYLVLGP